jgi:putative transposase
VIRYDPRDLAEIRVFCDDRFLARALCAELAGRTLALKDLTAARNARRRELRRGIRERDSLVDRLIAVHDPDYSMQPLAAPETPTEHAYEPKPRLKRYREE